MTVRSKPPNEMPQPIHVINCKANGLACVCDTSMIRAKFVKWVVWHRKNLSSSVAKVETPFVDHESTRRTTINYIIYRFLGVFQGYQEPYLQHNWGLSGKHLIQITFVSNVYQKNLISYVVNKAAEIPA